MQKLICPCQVLDEPFQLNAGHSFVNSVFHMQRFIHLPAHFLFQELILCMGYASPACLPQNAIQSLILNPILCMNANKSDIILSEIAAHAP